MNKAKIITLITVPDYPDKVMTAKSRRPIFYVSETSRVRGRNIIPPSYLNEERYYFNEDGVLINRKTNEPQLANPQTAGKPRYWVVNFQDIWNQNITKQDRATKVDKLKAVLRPYIQAIREIRVFPIELNIYLYDSCMPIDISNRGAIYTKVIEDLLVSEGKIPDDSVEYINCSGRIKYIRSEEKKMEIVILKSDNK